MSIPKIINYVWFGKGKKSELIEKCINSWKKYCPDYKIIEWNESNFPMDYDNYFIEAYKNKKWAFASDVARLYVLYHFGGIYMDVDVEVFKPLDEFLEEPAFTGFEQPYYPVCATMGAEPGNPIIREFLDYYNGKEFKVEQDWTKYVTNTVIMSDILEQHGIDRSKNEIQRTENITIYPKEYFLDQNGYTMHWMQGTWRLT